MEEYKPRPLKAIREKCLQCVCGSTKFVRECTATDCALHPFRMGEDPFRKKRELSEEQLEELRQRLLGSTDEEE